MGELKEVAATEAEVKLVDRVKEIGNQVYLASLGVVAKVEEEGHKQYDKLLAVGQAARGEQAANDKTVVLVAFGVVETIKTESEKLVELVKTEGDKLAELVKTESDKLAEKVKAEKDKLTEKVKVEGEKLKADGQKLIDDLIAAGEKRKAA